MQDRILRIILWLIIFITVAHLASLVFYFYIDFWWLDIVMHFLGGLWGTLFFMWILFFVLKSPLSDWGRPRFAAVFIVTVIFNLLVSFFWEVFELKSGITFVLKSGYWQDTISDFGAAFSGGLLSILYFFRNLRSLEINDGEQEN